MFFTLVTLLFLVIGLDPYCFGCDLHPFGFCSKLPTQEKYIYWTNKITEGRPYAAQMFISYPRVLNYM